MEWTEAISKAVAYIEEHLTAEMTIEDIAGQTYISPYYFQKGFSLLCGMSVSEYIRSRRLSLAAQELMNGDIKVIDAALKYGYDSPDSFTKAFVRFHGVTPSAVQKNKALIKGFAPLKIKISLEGGYSMDYRIMKKESFSVLAAQKSFKYETAMEEVPQFWQEHFAQGNGQYVCGMFGINIDETMGQDTFEYLIADLYDPQKEVPEGFTVRTIPAFTWAVFPCRGPMPDALQDVNKKIFAEWLPALHDYDFAAGYCVEMYEDPSRYAKGTLDDNYYCEIWIPVKKK